MEESVDIFQTIKRAMDLRDIDIRSYSPLTLAYIGDGVYELVIRTMIVDRVNTSAKKLHRMSSSLVKASAQAELAMALLPELTEEEKRVYKRGRNAKASTTAKNATVSDYRVATGLEALMGYLYLTGQSKRMIALIRQGLNKTGKDIYQ